MKFDKIQSVYLTLGIYNVLLHCKTKTELAEARELAKQLDAAWEEWKLKANKIVSITHSPSMLTDSRAELTQPLAAIPRFMIPTARECVALLKSAYLRAKSYKLSEADALSRYNLGLRALIAGADLNKVEKLEFLVTTNVSVSRHTWQAYSGSSPILQNPCHFATHSLLGVGTASLALENVTRFVERVFEKAEMPRRLTQLQSIAATSRPLIEIPSDDDFWKTDFLYASPAKRSPSKVEEPGSPMPHITYFSGRDGFRSTLISLSAPVEVINGCNTAHWTLQTLTHELSHSLVRSIMGAVLPNFGEPEDVSRVKHVIDRPDAARNLFEQLRAFLTYAVWVMNSGNADEKYNNVESFGKRIRPHLREADEVITHVLDFLYHYGRDPFHYVRSLWASWAMIPRISDRTSEYLVRTLCALHSNNLRRDKSVEVTFDLFLNCLDQVLHDFPDALYIPQALSELREKKDVYIRELKNHVPLVKFCRYFLYSPEIDKALMREVEEALSGEPYRALYFSDQRITSPLRFIEELSGEKEPDTMRSVWMLQHLAHGLKQ